MKNRKGKFKEIVSFNRDDKRVKFGEWWSPKGVDKYIFKELRVYHDKTMTKIDYIDWDIYCRKKASLVPEDYTNTQKIAYMQEVTLKAINEVVDGVLNLKE